MASILLIEDDLTFSLILDSFLRRHGHHIDTAHTVRDGISLMRERKYDLLLLDYRLPDGNGIEVIDRAAAAGTLIPAVIMTSFDDVRTAVRAMRSGAFDYITKPVNPEELLMVINDALKEKNADAPKTNSGEKWLNGSSEVSRRLHEYIALVSPTEMSVIIEGESGTGKEHVARSIHMASRRAAGPFVAIDCGALAENLAASELFGHVKGAFTGALQDKKGQFEVANKGTLFLDEVGNLSYDIQVKLLRALQERVIQPVGSVKAIATDVRIITATNEDLRAMVAAGRFRQDLYHRLNEFKIQVPALRDRGDDLDAFALHFVRQAAAELGRGTGSISPEVMAIFRRYDWPGNLRELRNVVKRMVLLSQGQEAGRDTLPDEMIATIDHLPVVRGADLKALQEANEKETITKVLAEVRFNKAKAARMLNIDRKTLYQKMSRYGIEG